MDVQGAHVKEWMHWESDGVQSGKYIYISDYRLPSFVEGGKWTS